MAYFNALYSIWGDTGSMGDIVLLNICTRQFLEFPIYHFFGDFGDFYINTLIEYINRDAERC